MKLAANVMADLNDVYAWMDAGGNLLDLAMTMSPADDGTHSFGPSVQYVFHATSHAGADNKTAFFSTSTVETKVICTFASATSGQCWIVEGSTVKDYVKGDFSSTSGVASADGKLKVFAGRRSDPFFFNLAGFKKAVGMIEAIPAGALHTDAAGCPDQIPNNTRAALVSTLSTAQTGVPPCPDGQLDCFATFNTMAIVVQVDKSLVLHGSDHLLSVWGSTHAAQ